MQGDRTNYGKGFKFWRLTVRLTEKEYAYLNACRKEGESIQDVIKRVIYDDAYMAKEARWNEQETEASYC